MLERNIIKMYRRNPSLMYLKDPYGNTRLHLACYNRYKYVIRFLLKFLSPNIQNNTGETSFHYLAMYGLSNLAFKYRPDPNIQDGYGLTPFHYVCYFKSSIEIIAFMRIGANGFIKNRRGETPFDLFNSNHF